MPSIAIDQLAFYIIVEKKLYDFFKSSRQRTNLFCFLLYKMQAFNIRHMTKKMLNRESARVDIQTLRSFKMGKLLKCFLSNFLNIPCRIMLWTKEHFPSISRIHELVPLLRSKSKILNFVLSIKIQCYSSLC